MAASMTGRVLPSDTEIEWADPERRTDSQMADSAVKKQVAGVPWRQLMSDLGYTPQQIDRMEIERASDSLLSMVNVPNATP